MVHVLSSSKWKFLTLSIQCALSLSLERREFQNKFKESIKVSFLKMEEGNQEKLLFLSSEISLQKNESIEHHLKNGVLLTLEGLRLE